jgi:hypothetical protein
MLCREALAGMATVYRDFMPVRQPIDFENELADNAGSGNSWRSASGGNMSHANGQAETYHASLWEKLVTTGASLTIIGLVVFVVIRNQPFADPNVVVLLRFVLALALASLGATIPGFLHVGISGYGVVIRAGGALALFVLGISVTPTVLDPYLKSVPGVKSEVFEGSDFIAPLAGGTLDNAQTGEQEGWLQWIADYLNTHNPPQNADKSRTVKSVKSTLANKQSGFGATMLIPNVDSLLATAFLVRNQNRQQPVYVPIALSRQTNIGNKYFSFDVPAADANDYVLIIIGGVPKNIPLSDDMFKLKPNNSGG